MINKKYALLDTDFISKMHIIRKDDQHKLIDKIMEMPNYVFYCHEQVKIEISRHDIAESAEWLGRMNREGRVHLYDDERILDELSYIYGLSAFAMYASMMKTACEAYKKNYFEENFVQLSNLDYSRVSRNEFLQKLRMDCDNIGEGRNLGELKTYVLLQTLCLKFGQQIYVFCSDDKNARKGIVSIGGARCISVLSAFVRLQKECGFSQEEAEPYIQSYLSYCFGKNQTTYKVQEASKTQRMCKVPCEQVFEDIFTGKFEELKTGILKYI